MGQVQVSVESSGLELGEALKDIILAAKSGGAASALEAAVADAVAVVQAIEALPADGKADLNGVLKGVLCGVTDAVAALVGK